MSRLSYISKFDHGQLVSHITNPNGIGVVIYHVIYSNYHVNYCVRWENGDTGEYSEKELVKKDKKKIGY